MDIRSVRAVDHHGWESDIQPRAPKSAPLASPYGPMHDFPANPSGISLIVPARGMPEHFASVDSHSARAETFGSIGPPRRTQPHQTAHGGPSPRDALKPWLTRNREFSCYTTCD